MCLKQNQVILNYKTVPNGGYSKVYVYIQIVRRLDLQRYATLRHLRTSKQMVTYNDITKQPNKKKKEDFSRPDRRRLCF